MINLKYQDRTPESVKQELDSFTEVKAQQLAEFLQTWMANEHNGKQFLAQLKEMRKENSKPADCCQAILGSAYDWFAYGN